MNEVMAKLIGMVKSCEYKASFGFLATLEKSSELTIRVAKLAIEDMTPLITAHANLLPCRVCRWSTIGPSPPAR